MNAQAIAARIRQLRRDRGLTQAKAAKACKVTPSAWAQYETGERIARDDVKIRMANFFGVTVGSIFYGENAHSE